jgi:hypothetical protein
MSKEKLKTDDNIQEVVNSYAETVAKDYNIKPHQFRIILDRHAKHPMHCNGGPTVQIYLAWPYCMHKMNSYLRSAFNLMRNNKLLHPVALVSHTFHAEQRAGYVSWMRQKIGPDADVLMNLVPKGSYIVQREQVVRIQDRKSRKWVEVRDTTGRTSWDLEEEARFHLSKELYYATKVEEVKEEKKQTTALVLASFYHDLALQLGKAEMIRC